MGQPLPCPSQTWSCLAPKDRAPPGPGQALAVPGVDLPATAPRENSLFSWPPAYPPTYLCGHNPGTSLGTAQQHLWASTCTTQRASEPGLTCPPSGRGGKRDQQGDRRLQEWRARDREKAVGRMRRAGQVGELGKDGGSSWGQRVHLEREDRCSGRARRMGHRSWGRGSITSVSPWPGAGSVGPGSPNGRSLGERELLGSGRGCREMERDPFGQTPASFFLVRGSQMDCHFVTSVGACGHLQAPCGPGQPRAGQPAGGLAGVPSSSRHLNTQMYFGG